MSTETSSTETPGFGMHHVTVVPTNFRPKRPDDADSRDEAGGEEASDCRE